jgi:hypothetical protein
VRVPDLGGRNLALTSRPARSSVGRAGRGARERIAGATEEEIVRALGKELKAPELRGK